MADPTSDGWTRDPILEEAKRVARARRRRNERLKVAGMITGWLAAVVLLCVVLDLVVVNNAGLKNASPSGAEYSDSLSSDPGGWPHAQGCTFHDNAYHVAPLGTKFSVFCLSPAGGFGDFDASVRAELTQGSPDGTYGLIFHVSGPDAYAFVMTANGAAAFYDLSTGAIHPLAQGWTVPGAAAGASGSHVLEVRARGNAYSCLVDGAQVGTMTDTSHAKGEIGVFVGQPGMDVAFTNFTVKAV